MKTKITIGIISAVVIIGITATLLLLHHHQRVDFPKSSWASAGHADPPSTLATTFLDASNGDGEKLLVDLSPDMQDKLQQQFGKQMEKQGISLAQFLSQMGSQWAKGVNGFHVISQEIVSDNQITLHVQFQGKKSPEIIKMKKIGGEWKLDEFS